jgi:Uma2 family endonuclease
MATAVKPMTAEQFAQRYADVPFCELVRGEVVELTVGGLRHSRITLRACYLLESWAKASGRGRAFTGEAGLITQRDPDTVRGADVLYYSYSRLPADQEPTGFGTIPPELVIEVVGKGQGWDAMVEKTGEYLAMGVDRAWVLDPESQTLHLFGGDARPSERRGQDEIRDELILPGFSCHVADFFHDRPPAWALSLYRRG